MESVQQNAVLNPDDGIVQVRMLGGFSIRWKGELVHLERTNRTKVMQILQILLYMGENGATSEMLMEELFAYREDIWEKNMRREFTQRWRTSGDELKTNIPGLRTKNVSSWWNNTKYTSSGLMPTFAPSDIYAMYDNSSIRVAKGNYLKLQSLSFRYNVHDEFCKKIGIQSAYLSITGTNMFTITNKALKGQDVTQSGAAPTVNMSLRPNYSFTLNVTF